MKEWITIRLPAITDSLDLLTLFANFTDARREIDAVLAKSTSGTDIFESATHYSTLINAGFNALLGVLEKTYLLSLDDPAGLQKTVKALGDDVEKKALLRAYFIERKETLQKQIIAHPDADKQAKIGNVDAVLLQF